eukprot:g8371.t1 g8371   contig29:369312-370157(+)
MTSPFTTEAAAFNPTLLLLFLTLWLFAYYITVLSPTHGAPNGFESSALLSNLHSVPLCILAALSLLDIVDEVYPLCWSLSFFVVDVLDCAVRRDLMWGVHGMISLVLNVATGGNGVHRGLRSLSKGFFTEASTPFLNHWKLNKNYTNFLIFFTSFTVCRILWVPYFIYNTYAIHLQGKIDYLIWPSVLFYVLQLFWYVKMVGMVFHYRLPKEVIEREKKAKKKS